MPEPILSDKLLREPSLQIRWAGKGDSPDPDIFPLRFFTSEGLLQAEIHLVAGTRGAWAQAKCDVRVKGLTAELDYEPYREFNQAHDMLLGVARLTFADEARTQLVRAEWRQKGRTIFQPSAFASAALVVPTGAETTPSRQYYRVMLGKGSLHAEECFRGGFIGTDFGIVEDLTGKLPADWREFNRQYIPIYLENHPGKSKIGAGLACGFLWTVARGILIGDYVLCPDGNDRYRVGEVTGEYYYAPGQVLFHRRPVKWTDIFIDRESMTQGLRNSAGTPGTVQRYMGFVLDEMAEDYQTVKGVIIALEDDQRIRRALRVTQNIEFFRYEVSFRLFRA